MGYETAFTLTIEDAFISDTRRRIIEELRQKHDGALYALETDGSTREKCKWYDHEEEMLSFSRLHPDYTFILEGHGDDRGDEWQKRFINGHMATRKQVVRWEPWG